jgi:hypothetical protein
MIDKPQALKRSPLKSIEVHPHQGFNQDIAVWITQKVGTMWCAYLFAALALISFPAAVMSGNVIVIVAWIAQTFFQLVLLPVIIVGQNVQTAYADKRAEGDHEILSALDAINRQQLAILQKLEPSTSTGEPSR